MVGLQKAMTKLDTIFKSRDISLPTKVYIVKAVVFPVVMYGCESWTTKEAEHWRIDAFELWFWRKHFESPLYNKEIKQVNPKGNQPWIFLGGLMLKLKLQCFGHLMSRAGSLEKTWCLERLKAGGEGSKTGWDSWMSSSTQWTWVWSNSRR